MNLAGLSLRDLEYIVAIAEHGSFRRAAKQCAVAQPSLSGQVRKLEEWLGISIFERTTRRVITTEQGKPVIDQARRVLEEARTLLILARPSGRPFGGSLRLAAISTLGPYLFPRVLPHLRARYPDLALLLGEGRTDDLLTALVAGEHDAVLIALPNPHEAISVAPCFANRSGWPVPGIIARPQRMVRAGMRCRPSSALC
jgi:LysR family transcriptional regulator, hydrogen peroxide-inducible genes activator